MLEWNENRMIKKKKHSSERKTSVCTLQPSAVPYGILIHATNHPNTNDTVLCYVFDNYICPEWRKIKIVPNKMPI